MTKFRDIYINQLPPGDNKDWDTFNILFLKIGDKTKIGISPTVSSNHAHIMESLLQSENIFRFAKQAGKDGKQAPKAEFFDEETRKHGKIVGCGLMTVDFRKNFIRFYGSSPEYSIGIKLLEARRFMENYCADSVFSYEVE
jgi:hypothetical protein